MAEQVAQDAHCTACGGAIGWIECPTGGWWAHETHPADEHDAVESVAGMFRQHLLTLMRGESEERYSAGWSHDLEYELWLEGGKWHVLARLAGGWWTRPESFVPLERWEAHYATHMAASGAPGEERA